MNLFSTIAVYFVVWWMVLFAVLPWGMRTQEEEGEVTFGTPASAPAKPMLVRKAIATSIVAAVVVFLLRLAIYEGFSFETIVNWFGLPSQ